MQSVLTTKIGDSLIFKSKFRRSDNSVVNLSNYTIVIEAKDRSGMVLFKVNSTTPTDNAFITTELLNIGELSLVIKDTSNFKEGTYYCDVKKTDTQGITTSSQTFLLKVTDKL